MSRLFFASVMFDEASNIHMAGLLNVFVNIITKDLQVRVFRFERFNND